MTAIFNIVGLVLLSIATNFGVSEAVDTPILPIPTSCPAVDPLNSTVHIKHEDDCSKFYTCSHGTQVLTPCPAGLHFNALLQVCDYPDRAGCTPGGSSSSSSPTTASPTTSSTRPTPTSSPSVDPRCPPPGPLNYTVHLPHETDCSKFLSCSNGVGIELDCPVGLHFNPVLEVCDWPSVAGCGTSSPSTPSSTPAPSPSPSPSPSPTPSSTCPFPDPITHTVHLPHESDCTKFYKCDHGNKVLFDCPVGLHFNKILEVCDWPSNAGCL